MKAGSIALLGLLLASCSRQLSSSQPTPPTFDFETTKQWQVGYPILSESREEVHAHTGGTVAFVSDDPENATNLGKYVILEHTKMLTGSGKNVQFKYYTLYAMLSETSVKVGQLVNVNAKVGMSGPTGRIATLENRATLLFGLYTETEKNEVNQLWGNPIKAYGKYWYDLEHVLGGSPGSPDKLTNTFDYASYARISLDSLLSGVKPNGGDQNFGFTKYLVSARIEEYPSPLSAVEKKALSDYVQANNLPLMMNHLYGSHFYLQQKDFKVAFFLQGTLFESFRKEVTLGKTIDLYLTCGFYDSKQRALFLMVNEFNAKN